MEAATVQVPGTMEYHGKAFLAASIGKNPQRAATVMAVLVVLALVLLVATVSYKSKYKACEGGVKNRFIGQMGVNTIGNMGSGMMNPLWQGGSSDAGEYGPVGRANTTQANAVWYRPDQPPWVRAKARLAQRRALKALAAGKREGMHPAPCGPGEIPSADGSMCMTPEEVIDNPEDDPDFDFDMGTCAAMWDPAAVAETQALSVVGGLDRNAEAEGRLQKAIEGGDTGLTDANLTPLLYSPTGI